MSNEENFHNERILTEGDKNTEGRLCIQTN